MQFTLDSVKHAKAVLKEQYKQREITKTPVLISDLSELFTAKENTYFFGVTTIGDNPNDVKFYNEVTDDILKVRPNSQSILLFKNLKSFDSDNNEVTAIKGQFRGFELRIE